MYRAIAISIAFLSLSTLSGCQTTGTPKEEGLQQAQEVSRAADLQTQLGLGYMGEGKYELAYERLKRALSTDPHYSTAHNALGLLYERLQKPEQAREHYALAVKYNPADSSARNNYGSFLCRQGELEPARAQFLAAVENPLYETPAIPYANLGLCMYQLGGEDEAETYLRRALELNPQIPNALIAMSDLSFSSGQELSARAYMQRYAEMGRQSPRSLWLGVQIERALGDLDTAASYALLLRSNYPDARETRLLLESETEWQ